MDRPPEDVVIGAAVGLGRALRAAGLPTTVDAELVLCRALAELDLRRRDHVYWAARSAMVRHRDDGAVFDALFARFWDGQPLTLKSGIAEHGESDPRMPGPQHGGESAPQFRTEGRSSQLLGGEPSRATREIPTAGGDRDAPRDERERRGVLAAYSPAEVTAEREQLDYASEELEAVRRLAWELRRAAPERRSRRLRPAAGGGRLDVRATIRRSLRTDGEPLRPAFNDHSRRPRRLLLLCDVSGSMERYSRALLGALEAVVGARLKAETFVFATRLTRVTGPLAGRHAGRALEAARESIPDWSGGTRIGPALAELNAVYGTRGFARGSIVIIVSDGWDCGDPELLARELARLRLQSRRLVWLNPRPTTVAGQPFAVGMRTALPHLDEYLPGIDPGAELGRVVARLGSERPSRAQRPRSTVAS